MRILALDTALPAVCACVLESGATEPLVMETLTMERGHAEALLPLIDEQEQAIGALETFKIHYPNALAQRMATKLGFVAAQEPQRALIESALQLLAKERIDFTIFWRRLSHWAATMDLGDALVKDLFVDRNAAQAWLEAFKRLHTQTSTDSPFSVSQGSG